MENPQASSFLNIGDIMQIHTLSHPGLSSGGEVLVWQRTIPQTENYRTEIVLSLPNTRKTICFEGSLPALSPCGDRLAYLSSSSVVTILSLQNGETHTIGEYCRVKSLKWSPDGQRLLFSASVVQRSNYPDFPLLTTVKWIDRLKFKTDEEGIWDGGYRQIFYWDAIEGCYQITDAAVDHFYPFWVGSDQIGYVVNLYDPDYSDRDSIIVQHLKEKNRKIIPGPGGPVSFPVADPCGQRIAFLSHDNHAWEASNFHLYLSSLQDGKTEDLTSHLDRSVGCQVLSEVGLDWGDAGICWSKNGKGIYALLTDKSCCNLVLFDSDTGNHQIVVHGERCIYSYAVSDSRILFVYTSPKEPVALAQIENGTESTLWKIKWEFPKSFPKWKTFSFVGHDGTEREGFYILPCCKSKGTVLMIHGGPHFCYGKTFFLDAYLLSSEGYGVVFCNPAGSQGAGESLSRATKLDWGGKDYKEIMLCVQKAKELFGLGTDRWAVMGGSYGGFMTNWIIGHNDFFQCAIAERSTCNRYSQAGTSDCAFRYGEFEFDGFPWDHPEHYLTHSPISYVRNISTPLLLLHGEEDMNCSISQSEEMFSALRLLKKEVYFARFPGQYHTFAEKGTPTARVERYKLILWWLDRYIGRIDDPDSSGKN